MAKGAKSCSEKFKMPRQANEIAVEWLEFKDAGKRNRVNVEYIIGKLKEVAVGGEVVIKLSLRRYRATVVDLLNWVPSNGDRRKRRRKRPRKSHQQRYVDRVVIVGIWNRCMYKHRNNFAF